MAISATIAPVIVFHREAEFGTNEEILGPLGVTTRPVPVPLLTPPPVPTEEGTLEGSTPELAGAFVMMDARLVATIVCCVVGMVVVPAEPGLGPKVVLNDGSGSGGMVTSLEIMLSISSTLLR